MTGQTSFYGWRLLVVFWLILFTTFAFPLYGASVVNAYMASDLHLDRSALGLAYGLFQWMVGLPAPLAAILINRRGVRFTTTLGCLVVMTGALLMALAVHTRLGVYVVFGVIIGLGALASGVLGAQSSIGQWFRRAKARAITLVHTGSGIGGFVAAPTLNRVIERFGGNWRVGWWLMAGLSLVGALLAVLFIKEKPSDLGQFPDGDPAWGEFVAHRLQKSVHKTTAEWTFRGVFQSGAIWLILFASLGISAGYPLVLAHGVVHLEDLGYTASEAAQSIAAMLLSSLVGQLIVIAWGDRIEPRWIWALGSAVFAVGMILALNAHGRAGLFGYAVCLGVGFGASFSCLMTLPGNYYGAQAYASILGVMIAVGTTAGAAGPYLAGKAFDHYGSYEPAFYWVAGLCLAAAVVLPFATPPLRRRAPSLAPAR